MAGDRRSKPSPTIQPAEPVSTPAVATGASLFKRYRVELHPRSGADGPVVAVELLARTRGSARRAAAQQHPEHVVRSVTRVD